MVPMMMVPWSRPAFSMYSCSIFSPLSRSLKARELVISESSSPTASSNGRSGYCAFRTPAMRSRMPFTMDASAHPGFRREDSTSNVCFPKEASSGM